MFLDDTLREQLPRQLKGIEIHIMPYLLGDTAEVTFKANGREVDLKVDSEAGLTDLQLADICARL